MKARKPKPSRALTDISAHRRKSGLTQWGFWPQYGVTQSGGSRYERGRSMPKTLALLLVLQEQGVISGEQLAKALAVVNVSKGIE